jgi:hypothetical protein
MARLHSLLKKFEEGRYVNALNPNLPATNHAEVIGELQARYDYLAGVPPVSVEDRTT